MPCYPITSNFEFNRFALLLSKYDYTVKQNDILAGRIIGLEYTHAIVDLGLKRVAFLPLKEICSKLPKNPNELLKINLICEFLILSIDKKSGQVIISLKQIQSFYSWERLKQINFQTSVIYAKLAESVGRGKILRFNNLRIFALNLHIPKYYRRKRETKLFLPLKIVEVKDSIHTVYVNSRLALFSKLSKNIDNQQTYYGTIISIRDFGIFLNILGIQCLLHISQLKIQNLALVYQSGQLILVNILYKDLEQGKISLTLKNTNLTTPPRQL